MDKAERSGLGLALGGHALLFAVLTFGIAHRVPPLRPVVEAMDVQLVDAVGLRSAAPTPATEAPREAEAPTVGPPAEAPPAAPVLTPAPPSPAPPQPAPPRPAPKAEPVKPAPVAEKPAPPAKPVPKSRLLPDILKDVRSAARHARPGSNPAAKAERAAGARLGPDFLKGVLGTSAGKGESARAAVSGPAMNGLAAALKRQVQPCYDLGGLGGTPAMEIVTILRLRYNRDGSVAGNPQVVDQTGIGAGNRAYAQQIAEVARRAVLRCSPVRLPAELYEGGWDDLDFRFTPKQMQ